MHALQHRGYAMRNIYFEIIRKGVENIYLDSCHEMVDTNFFRNAPLYLFFILSTRYLMEK